jgi:hypothetical protein
MRRLPHGKDGGKIIGHGGGIVPEDVLRRIPPQQVWNTKPFTRKQTGMSPFLVSSLRHDDWVIRRKAGPHPFFHPITC